MIKKLSIGGEASLPTDRLFYFGKGIKNAEPLMADRLQQFSLLLDYSYGIIIFICA